MELDPGATIGAFLTKGFVWLISEVLSRHNQRPNFLQFLLLHTFQLGAELGGVVTCFGKKSPFVFSLNIWIRKNSFRRLMFAVWFHNSLNKFHRLRRKRFFDFGINIQVIFRTIKRLSRAKNICLQFVHISTKLGISQIAKGNFEGILWQHIGFLSGLHFRFYKFARSFFHLICLFGYIWFVCCLGGVKAGTKLEGLISLLASRLSVCRSILE
mmetsp:Transcript_25869/g.29572  ORF Transcript_25869/g.29572 Transcript_25869/m.29572 type:complete len:213 (+) Transcript_25869:708-1346(+)